MNCDNLITHCCICDGEIETKKILPFRDLIGTTSEIYNMHIAICDKCGFIFQQNPLTAEQLENRYKNQSKYEFDDKNYILPESDDYKSRCLRQKHFIDENLNIANDRSIQYNKLLPDIISVFMKARNELELSLQR